MTTIVQQMKKVTRRKSLCISLLIAVVSFFGFGNQGDTSLIPYANADTPHTGGSPGGDG